MTATKPVRVRETAKERLTSRATREGLSARALLERIIAEGIDQLDHPGIVFRGPAHDRRAALANGPDVWEVVARLQELTGSTEQRIATLSAELELRPRLIRAALDYAAAHADDTRRRIILNREMARQGETP